MSQEQGLELSPTLPTTDPYKLAFTIGDMLLEYYQERGEMMRASEIEDEFQQEEHFDQLSRHYRWVCSFMGLAWPPPLRTPVGDAEDTHIFPW